MKSPRHFCASTIAAAASEIRHVASCRESLAIIAAYSRVCYAPQIPRRHDMGYSWNGWGASMFFIVWRGWGIIVVPIFLAAMVVAVVVVQGLGAKTPLLISSVWAVCAVIAGFGTWFFANRIESQPGRVLIDKASGREFTVKKSAGSLFFVPTKYWAFVGSAFVIFIGLCGAYVPPPHPADPASITTTQKP
jgi:hypothetical protein